MESNDDQTLVLYDEMRLAIERCAKIDEAALIRDASARLAAYARICNDEYRERNYNEINLRSIRKFGQLSQELEKAEAHGGQIRLPSDGKSKSEQLAEVGISTSTAQRYEQLAGPLEEQAQEAANAAADSYFAKQHAEKQPITMQGLKAAVEGALIETLGEPPKRTKKPKEVFDHRFIHFIGPIRDFQRKRAEYDPSFFASEEMEFIVQSDIEACEDFIMLVQEFVSKTKERFTNVFGVSSPN